MSSHVRQIRASYRDWRGVIAEYVGERLGQPAHDALTVLVGHVSLALAQSAYDAWLADASRSLPDLVSAQMALLRDHLALPSG